MRDHGDIDTVPYSIKVLLESALRKYDGHTVTAEDVIALASYDAAKVDQTEIPFSPGRVVLQDFTGVPAIVDLAAMRDAIVRMTGNIDDAKKVNPLVPCDLVIDHSVQVDAYNSNIALGINSQREFERNRERYAFLKWGQSAFDNFRVVPPATGIVHQVNLEYLARVVWDDGSNLYPDSVVGTDSHTTMINGLGVLGWGVGGIEAEAAMVGRPIFMLIPEVVGVRLNGHLPEGATATDLVLRVTEMLRAHGVVGRFVEFHGPGLDSMPVANRATIANMAPEYGATCGFFPIDRQTIAYLELSGRSPELIEAVEQYAKLQGLWRDDRHEIVYSSVYRTRYGTDRTFPGRTAPASRPNRAAGDEKAVGTRSELHFRRPRPSRRDQGGGARRRNLRLGRRCGGHSSHHQLHEHIQPGGDGGSGPLGPEGPGIRPGPQTLGQNITCSRLQGGHRVSGPGRADRRPRGDGFLQCGVRMHHMHRQFGTSARADSPGDRAKTTWWSRPYCPATVTSRAGSART